MIKGMQGPPRGQPGRLRSVPLTLTSKFSKGSCCRKLPGSSECLSCPSSSSLPWSSLLARHRPGFLKGLEFK